MLELVGYVVGGDLVVVDVALGAFEPVDAAVLGEVVPGGAEDEGGAGDDAGVVHVCRCGDGDVAGEADDDEDEGEPEDADPGDSFAPKVAEIPYARFEAGVGCQQTCQDGDHVRNTCADHR